MAKGTISNGGQNSDLDKALGLDKSTGPVVRHKENLELLKQYEKQATRIEKELNKLRKDGLLDFEKSYWQKRKEALEEEADMLRERQVIEQDAHKKQLIALESSVNKIKTGLTDTVEKTTKKISDDFDEYIGSYQKYLSVIDTRLQGADKSFSSITEVINKAVGSSALVTQTKVYEKLSNLVEQGINYNVEQRAFLASVSDRIASTFDAANGTLLQLIKIQQADTTVARLGIESSLTKFLNNTFKDTSYLNSGGLSESVSAAILGANSQLSRDSSVEFEYVVQKWLGSMSSVGVSDSTIQQLAQGLNYLGTGDIASLNSNTSLQNLLVMAANQAGLDYAQLLTGGMNATTANKLLQSVVQYGQSIASTNNQVVKSQYANLFGMTISDLTSLLNLSTKDLQSISSNMLSYSNTIAETEKGLATIGQRTSFGDMLSNLYKNVLATMGEGIASNPALYATWKINSLIEDATGGINIPFISAFGSGVDLNVNLNQLAKLGIVGVSTLTNLGTIISGISRIAGFDLNAFDAEATTGRGRGLASTYADSNVATSISNTSYVGNSSSSDIYTSSIAAAKDEAAQTVTSQEENEVLNLLRDRIAPDVSTIVELLATDGIVVREVNALSSLGLLGG